MTPEPTPEVAALRELHRVVMLVHSGKDLGTVLQAAVEGVVGAAGFESAAINLLTERGDYEVVTSVGPGTDVLMGTRNDRADFEDQLNAGDAWGALRFIPAGRWVESPDVTVYRPDGPPIDAPDAWLPDDMLLAPLCDHQGEMLGILSVDLPVNRRRPSLLRRQCLEMYAVQIGLAIAHARDRDDMERRVRLSRTINAVVNTASEATNLDDLLEGSLEPLLEGFRSETAWIHLFPDEAGGWQSVDYPKNLPATLREVAVKAAEPPASCYDLIVSGVSRMARKSWTERRTVVITDRGQDTSDDIVSVVGRSRVLHWLRATGRDTFVLLPLGAAEGCLGFVVLTRSTTAGEWTAAEVDASLEVGRELGRAIGLARVRAREAQLLDQLERLDTHKNEMITTVVHELKNPLTSIRGNLELVQDDPDVAERAYAAIAFNVDRMLGLVQNMLTLTRLRDCTTELHPVPVDLSALVASSRKLVEIQAQRAGVSLDLVDIAPEVELSGNREQLERLMLNLMSNAVKFSEPGTSVSLALTRVGSSVEFSVTDEGLGISVDDQRHLFEEFHRSSNPEARSRPGTGLGLAIVAKIVERHAGRIFVTSQLGVGSTFRVRLPAG